MFLHPAAQVIGRMAMLNYDNARAVAYEVLDQVLADEAVAAGARGAMFSVVDSLRASSAPHGEVRRAERISIELHKLEWARQQQDDEAAAVALDELKTLAVSWLDARIIGNAI
jgi:hypothetical protein